MYRHHKRPRRGGPAILITCETGRTHKAKMEALDILHHYCSSDNIDNDDDAAVNKKDPSSSKKDDKKLSLDDEIAKLKDDGGGKSESSRQFEEYNTSVGGTVILMCTIANAELIESIQPLKEENQNDDESNNNEKDPTEAASEPAPKKQKIEEDGDPAAKPTVNPEKDSESSVKDDAAAIPLSGGWDPVVKVRRIIQDLKDRVMSVPSSRYVLRMIPMQATCYPSLEEIQLTTRALVARFLPAAGGTFAIKIKRRCCSLVKREDLIPMIAREIVPKDKWKVDLRDPGFLVQVEICQNLCGISLVEKGGELGNFNLLELREKQQRKDKTS